MATYDLVAAVLMRNIAACCCRAEAGAAEMDVRYHVGADELGAVEVST